MSDNPRDDLCAARAEIFRTVSRGGGRVLDATAIPHYSSLGSEYIVVARIAVGGDSEEEQLADTRLGHLHSLSRGLLDAEYDGGGISVTLG